MKRFFVSIFVALCAVSCHRSQINIDSVASPKGTEVFKPDWDSIARYYEFPEWFTDGKFGIFIHWGVYAVPAFGNEWYAHGMYKKDSPEFKHHVATYGEHTQFGYKDFIPMFKAEKFDADEWAALFKAAGAKYVVPVAEHHDGFSMYDSDLNEWNSVKMGPHKDIVGLLKQAVEKEGLVFGLSSHRAEHWWYFNEGMHYPSDVRDGNISMYGPRLEGKLSHEFARDWLAHTYELVNKYQPSLIWFDWTVNDSIYVPYFNRFMAYYYNNAIDWGKKVVVNTKQGYPTNIQVWDLERGKSGNMMKFPWQTDTSVGKKSWGYIENEENKTPQQIVHDLIDIVSKNGNLLLNIGPRPDGTITDEQREILLKIGEWLAVNGEAIYGTRCWKRAGEGDAQPTQGSFTDNTATQYTSRDMRFTVKGTDMYITALSWNDTAHVTVTSLTPDVIGDAKITAVSMLGSDEKIEWEQTDGGLILSFPKKRPCDFAYSFKVSFDKLPGEKLASEAVNETMKYGQ